MDDDGYVVFDVESIAGETPPSPWIFRSDTPCTGRPQCEVLGTGFYQFIQGDQCGQVGPGDGLIEFQFEAKRSGLHRFAWRNMRDHSGGCEHDRNNDSYLAFPTANADDHLKAPFKAFGGGNNDFDWWATYDIEGLGKNEICLDFDAGVHTVQIMGRSNQHAIDRIALIRVESGESDCLSPARLDGLDERPVTGRAP